MCVLVRGRGDECLCITHEGGGWEGGGGDECLCITRVCLCRLSLINGQQQLTLMLVTTNIRSCKGNAI